jgi:hypothetical protein
VDGGRCLARVERAPITAESPRSERDRRDLEVRLPEPYVAHGLPGWPTSASEDGSALLGAKTSDRSCGVFRCSGRSTATSFGVCASATASPGRRGGSVVGDWPAAGRTRGTSAPIRSARTIPANALRRFGIGHHPWSRGTRTRGEARAAPVYVVSQGGWSVPSLPPKPPRRRRAPMELPSPWKGWPTASPLLMSTDRRVSEMAETAFGSGSHPPARAATRAVLATNVIRALAALRRTA